MNTQLLNRNNVYSDINLMIISLILFYLGIAVIFSSSIFNFNSIFIELIVLLISVFIVTKTIPKIKIGALRSASQTFFVLLFFAYFFGISSNFQLVFHHNWFDAKLIAFDKMVFGNELSLILENIISPYLTETMMFAYVSYLPLLIITAAVAYKSGKEKGAAEYLSVISLCYVFCYSGFILFPVASQTYFMPEKYSVPLSGGLFTYTSELVRNNFHFPGGSLPSPHCTAATVILWACYKYNKNVFFIILFPVILLYISTVYGRFHYALDSLSGIVTGFLSIKTYPLVIRIIDIVKNFFNNILHPVSAQNSLIE
ncbi:MAG: phosphatase PAP2 family protein [Ignavibacteriaceae bacterium]|jgi:membrane-associated phospholipid phosphatase|nr:phosphatase PAP2 family protein [Ignavibacteriaceae bacterium]